MKKSTTIILISFLSAFFMPNFTYGQEIESPNPKFGGPFVTMSYNKYGSSFSIGGGGTFWEKKGFYTGIYGQITTDAIKRSIVFQEKEGIFSLKSRQTGFWIGYSENLKYNNKIWWSIYNKIGFGKAFVDNRDESFNYYDNIIVITPNIELSYRVASFLEIGIAGFYEVFTGVDLFEYTNSDFNAYGASLMIKFRKSD